MSGCGRGDRGALHSSGSIYDPRPHALSSYQCQQVHSRSLNNLNTQDERFSNEPFRETSSFLPGPKWVVKTSIRLELLTASAGALRVRHKYIKMIPVRPLIEHMPCPCVIYVCTCYSGRSQHHLACAMPPATEAGVIRQAIGNVASSTCRDVQSRHCVFVHTVLCLLVIAGKWVWAAADVVRTAFSESPGTMP